MTTRVRIENPRDNEHSINVWKGDGRMTRDEHIAQIPPGDQHVCHIWEGVRLVIIEVPNKLKKDDSASIST